MRTVTNRRSRFTARASGVAVALAVGLAGCGGSSPSAPSAAPKATTPEPSPAKILLASARTTASAGSARMSMSMNMGGTGASAVVISADGIADFATGDSQLTMHFGGDMAGFMAGDFEVRSVDNVAYMKLPASRAGPLGSLSRGKEWLSIDASQFGGAASPTAGLGLGQTDPTQFLAYLETVSDDVKAVGSETMRGVETTHYYATLDLGKAVDRAEVPPELRDSLHELLDSVGKGAPKIPSDVWVDGAGRVRRIAMQFDLASFGAPTGALGSDAVIAMSIDLYDFGVPVNVQSPPADDVASLPMFGMGELGGFGATEPTSGEASSTQ